MMRIKCLPSLFAAVLLLNSSASPAADAAAGAKVLVTVNGKPITGEMLGIYTQRRLADGSAQRDESGRIPNLMSELIGLEVLTQEAERQGLQNDPLFQTTLELTRRNLLAQNLMEAYLRDHPVTDADLHKAYELVTTQVYGPQYHIFHIQVADEVVARKLIAQLKQGADFTELAKAHSDDPTGRSGGELGWFSKGQLPEEFAAAIDKTKTGSFADEPVKSSHGWHVVRVAASRKQPAPSFEDSRHNLENLVRRQHLQAYVDQLRSQSRIERPR